MTENSKPKNFLDAIKKAQQNKTSITTVKAKQIQQAKHKSQVTSNRPTKRAANRGG
jgi:hypothetical protein